MTTGLVLTGGGARGAYQAGVLHGIAQICKSKEIPFSVVTGVSAGAIDGSYVAALFDDFYESTKNLCTLWENLEFNRVVRTSPATLFSTGSRWMFQMTMGSLSDGRSINHLLDTHPLEKLISERIPFERIRDAVKQKKLKGLAISTTNYATGTEVIFYEADQQTEDWVRANRISRYGQIGVAHVMASSAIPVFFPPVRIENSFYGDGSVRSRSPLSPAIHLGSEKILAISVRKKKTKKELLSLNEASIDKLSIAEIAGVLLNALFLDSIGPDLERLQRINRTLESHTGESTPDKLKNIECLSISPSEDLGTLAKDSVNRFPKGLKYLFAGIGSKSDRGLELLSYLAFEKNYTSKLVEIGLNDALQNKDKIMNFFRELPHKDAHS